jgi:chitinase
VTTIRSAAVALAVLLGGAAIAPGAPADRAAAVSSHHARWVMGYYPIYQRGLMPVSEIDWSAMTHLVVGAVLPRADGSLDTSFDDDPTHGPKIAKRLATAASAHGVVPVLMVGGAGAHDGFAAAATNHRGALVRHLLATMRDLGFSGLDLDWEPVQQGEGTAIKRLVRALRDKAAHAVLTMPVGWVTRTFPHVSSLYAALAKWLNRINVMTYEMAGAYDGWVTWHSSALKGAGDSTPSSIAVNIRSYLRAGVPARKLGIGVGFYGTCWAGGVDGPRQPVGSSYVAASDNVMSFTTIKSTYYSSTAYRYDETAQAPYLSFSKATGPQHCTYVSYENKRSIIAKGAFAEKHGLGAEIVWTINQAHVSGAPAGRTDPLLKAVRRGFH